MPKIDGLFKIMRDQGASDLHLSPGNPPLIRVSGSLAPALQKTSIMSSTRCFSTK